jgi:hypothetical protein
VYGFPTTHKHSKCLLGISIRAHVGKITTGLFDSQEHPHGFVSSSIWMSRMLSNLPFQRELEDSPPMDIAATQQIARRRGRETDTLASQLYSAAKSGNTNTVRFLLECGVNPDAGGEDGFTPLMTGHAHVVSLLLSNPRCNASLRNSYGQVAYSVLTHDPMNPRPPCCFPQPPSQRL